MRRIIILAAVLNLGAAVPALAQTVKKFESIRAAPVPSAATLAAAPAAKAPFGCDARSPGVCHFRVYFGRGSREVVLPAGMKQAIPDVRVGSDTYCVAMNAKPAPKCVRKAVNANYNS